jgi:hypothetical protein
VQRLPVVLRVFGCAIKHEDRKTQKIDLKGGEKGLLGSKNIVEKIFPLHSF